MIRRTLLYLAPIVLVLALSCGTGGGTSLHVWDRFEVTLDVPVGAGNPFDPAQAELTGEFVSPSGQTRRIPGFASREYTRKLVDGVEKLTAQGDPSAGSGQALRWKLRFTPTEAGRWKWRWSLTTPAGTQTSEWKPLKVSGTETGQHGFLRRSPDDGRYLRFDDGAQYFAVGENLAWYDQRGTFAYDDWFAKLQRQGVNYVRLWMPSWAFGLEWTEPNTLGDYQERLDRAWQLDDVLLQAARHGIYVMLSIQNHGAFSLTANSEWDRNPYNAANGGPLAQPPDFFTDDAAKELFKRRLRYIVARWGYSPNVLGWELWNEVDLAEQPDLSDVVAWHQEMARELLALDPYRHLISTSLSGPWGLALLVKTDLATVDMPHFALWSLPEIDFAQAHLYSVNKAALDWSDALPKIAANLRRFGKPVLIAEAGVDFRGPSETLAADPDGAGFHDMLWAGLFAGTFGTGMSWWWDNVVDPQRWYFHFGPVTKFVDGVAFDREGFATGTATASLPNIRALSLAGRSTALVWVKNGAHQWYAPDPSQVDGATVDVQGLGAGRWHATWLDTYSGEVAQETDVHATGESLELAVPSFSRDIALRLDRAGS